MKIDVPWLFLSESVACFFTPLYQLFTYYLRKECPRTNFLSLVFEKMGSKSCKALKFLRKKVFKLYIFIPTLPPLRNCQGNKTTAQLSWGKFCSIFSLRKKGTWYSSFTVRDFSGVLHALLRNKNFDSKGKRYQQFLAELSSKYKVNCVNLSLGPIGITGIDSLIMTAIKNVYLSKETFIVSRTINICTRTASYIFFMRNKEWENP